MMKTPASLFTLLLLVSGLHSAQASSLPDQGLRLLLGEPAAESSLNLRFSQPLGTYTNFFGGLSQTNLTDLNQDATENSITTFGGGIEWFLTQPQKMQWFLLSSMSGAQINHANQSDTTPLVLSFGIGQHWAINASDAMRWELRANQPIGNDSPQLNWTPVDFQAIFSYQWGR